MSCGPCGKQLREDQENEIEALSSIYGSDFAASDATNNFTINLAPGIVSSEKVWVACRLVVTLPPTYPDEAPAVLALDNVRGLTAAQISELTGLMGACAVENAGGPYIYTVAEVVREYLTAHNEKPSDGSAFDEMLRLQRKPEAAVAHGAFSREDDPSISKRVVISAAEADEAVRLKRDGTPVTKESFAAWRAAFEEEMALKQKIELDACVFWGGSARGSAGLGFAHRLASSNWPLSTGLLRTASCDQPLYLYSYAPVTLTPSSTPPPPFSQPRPHSWRLAQVG